MTLCSSFSGAARSAEANQRICQHTADIFCIRMSKSPSFMINNPLLSVSKVACIQKKTLPQSVLSMLRYNFDEETLALHCRSKCVPLDFSEENYTA